MIWPQSFIFALVASFITDGDSTIAADPVSVDLLKLGDRVARAQVNVFVNGPTGSGKEVLAQYIHKKSSRAEKPFVAINCAAIPENMLEALLFGHKKGAFTGASTSSDGIFQAADGGTLLLDEVSEMSMPLQAKLLRVLQERFCCSFGGFGANPCGCAHAGDVQPKYTDGNPARAVPRRSLFSLERVSFGHQGAERTLCKISFQLLPNCWCAIKAI